MSSSRTPASDAPPISRPEEGLLRHVVATMPVGWALLNVFLDDPGAPIDFTFEEVNARFERQTGRSAAQLVGCRLSRALPGLQSREPALRAVYAQVALEGMQREFEIYLESVGESYRVHAASPRRGMLTVTLRETLQGPDRSRLEALVRRRTAAFVESEERLARRVDELLDLSLPIIVVEPGVLFVPLSGTVADARAERLQARLKQALLGPRVSVVLLDIATVAVVDSLTADNLLQVVRSLRAMGLEVVLSGVRKAEARALSHLGMGRPLTHISASLGGGLNLARTLKAPAGPG